ncbi:MAG: hypothetical protein HXL64_06400, partial [Thermobifida sp.]|nr:hypothetical protein [Thermobifida sp.]
EIDLALPSVRGSYADGRPLDGAAVLGRDLPAGSTITLSSRVLSAQQLNEASERQENQWLSPVLALLGYCFIVIGAVSALCLLPMVADAALVGFAHPEDGPKWAVAAAQIPLWERGTCAAVCCAASILPLFASRAVRSRPALLLLMPALAGYSAIGFVSMAGIHALSVAPVIGVWVALAVSLAVVSLTATPTALSGLFAWIGATALVTIGAYPMFSLIDIAPLALLLGVFLFLMAPRFALRVPDSQLVDSASVQTIASRIRQPPAQKPSTVTGGRMADALGHTDARYTLLVAASTLFILVGGIPLAYTVTPAITLGRGLGGFIFVIMSILVLLTAPRGIRAHAGQILPRIAAAGVGCAFLFGTWAQSWAVPTEHEKYSLFPLLPLAILLIIAIATVLWMTLHVPKGHAALSGTILDFMQTFCIFTLLPAAVISSGLFEFAWRAVL